MSDSWFDLQLLLLNNIMGCTPPQKRRQSIPAINAVPKKTVHFSPRQSENSKNSTQTNENNMQHVPIVPKIVSNQSLQSQRRNKNGEHVPNSVNLKKKQSLKSKQRFTYEHRESPQKQMERQMIRIMSPCDRPKPAIKVEAEEASKLTLVHSLDIVSKIKTPKEERADSNKQGERRRYAKGNKVQQVNITFNSNDFTVAQSKTKTLPSRKGWRQKALINELKFMNNQNFKRIPVNSRNFQ